MNENRQTPLYVGPKPTDRLLTKAEIKDRFDRETASAYSQEDPVYLPEYAATFELLADCVAAETGPAPEVLDVGAGTGNLSLRLLRRLKDSRVTLLDFSENMLGCVPAILKGFEGQYRAVSRDFFETDFEPASFDAIISSFAIHHARGKDEYRFLYTKFKSWLKPGGIFACIDVVNGNAPSWTQINEKGWCGYLANYFGETKIDQILANYHSEDSPVSLAEHFECLKAAGFANVDVLWKRFNFALYCAK